MNDEKFLTKEIAERFLADENSVNLSEFTTLSDEAAESLSEFNGFKLCLDGLTTLSDAAADSLGKFRYIHLTGLATLSDTAADILGEFWGCFCRPDKCEFWTDRSYLLLNGLTHLSDAAAHGFTRHAVELVVDFDLNQFSESAARNLKQHRYFADHVDDVPWDDERHEQEDSDFEVETQTLMEEADRTTRDHEPSERTEDPPF